MPRAKKPTADNTAGNSGKCQIGRTRSRRPQCLRRGVRDGGGSRCMRLQIPVGFVIGLPHAAEVGLAADAGGARDLRLTRQSTVQAKQMPVVSRRARHIRRRCDSHACPLIITPSVIDPKWSGPIRRRSAAVRVRSAKCCAALSALRRVPWLNPLQRRSDCQCPAPTVFECGR